MTPENAIDQHLDAIDEAVEFTAGLFEGVCPACGESGYLELVEVGGTAEFIAMHADDEAISTTLWTASHTECSHENGELTYICAACDNDYCVGNAINGGWN